MPALAFRAIKPQRVSTHDTNLPERGRKESGQFLLLTTDDRAFAVTSFAEAERADWAYWRSRTPDERLEALELCRQIACGCGPTASRQALLSLRKAVSSPPGRPTVAQRFSAGCGGLRMK